MTLVLFLPKRHLLTVQRESTYELSPFDPRENSSVLESMVSLFLSEVGEREIIALLDKFSDSYFSVPNLQCSHHDL